MTATRKLIGWLVSAALLVAVMVTVSFWSFRQIEQTAAARQRTNAVLSRTEELMRSLVDAETSQRGFLLTGDEAFLGPYVKVREQIPGELVALRELGGPGRQHLDRVAPLITAKLNFFGRNVELRRAGDLSAALENVRGAEGMALMDSIRTELGTFAREVQLDRDEREAAFQSSLRGLYATLVVTSLLTLVLALLFAWLIHRETAQRLQNELHLVTRRSLEAEEKTSAALQRANETLQLSEDKLAVTLDSIGDAVIATDAQARVTIINPEAARLTGWTRAEALGRNINEIFHIISEETRLPSKVPVDAALARGTTQGLANHTLLVARNGSECAIADSCAPIRARGGPVVGAVLVFRDVSKDHATQLALRDLQFYTRSLIESNVDALMTTDAHGIITDANAPMEALTGWARAELIGSAFKTHFTDPVRAEEGIALVLRDNKVSDYELTAHARGGALTVVSYNATTFHDRNGKLQGVFAAARDVTERKRLDLALREKNTELEKATALAEQASRAKSDFLSSMSHELRSPLNAILGFAQLLESDAPPPTANQAVGIAQILKAGWHLLTLINEILDLAKIESGQVPLSQEPVSLGEVLVECQGMVGPQAQVRGIRLAFPPVSAARFVRADRTRLKQVLINLLSNAIKYNSDGGTVTVTVVLRTPELVRVSITDTGAGLSPEQVGQLFQAFNRLGQESGGEEGTGIGLVVSRRLIELMGGTIGVESTQGAGSVFWFELAAIDGPHLSDEESLLARMPEAPSAVPQRTVLYVEDNPANLMLVQQIIARLPLIRLLTATDGYSGVEIARASLPDVILMDINLPGINGIEAMRILRTDPATAKIPVLALSANALPRDVEKGIEAGFFRYITKPIKVNEFLQSLNLALDERASL
ncbi:MAG: PAS domain S-box protein [Archangium sp.]|nr:PAS domain S-box protein [Archangium sp.]